MEIPTNFRLPFLFPIRVAHFLDVISMIRYTEPESFLRFSIFKFSLNYYPRMVQVEYVALENTARKNWRKL